jgi:hypothetical protein
LIGCFRLFFFFMRVSIIISIIIIILYIIFLFFFMLLFNTPFLWFWLFIGVVRWLRILRILFRRRIELSLILFVIFCVDVVVVYESTSSVGVSGCFDIGWIYIMLFIVGWLFYGRLLILCNKYIFFLCLLRWNLRFHIPIIFLIICYLFRFFFKLFYLFFFISKFLIDNCFLFNLFFFFNFPRTR